MIIEAELESLHELTVPQLKVKFFEVFGEATRANNKPWLVKRIAWRIQSLAEGTLSERARKRAEELANDADLRVTLPKTKAVVPGTNTTTTSTVKFTEHDQRLPMPGTILSREYKGKTVHVRVLEDGFEWEGHKFASLSAVAKAITGSHMNGFLFFRLAKKGAKS